MSELCEGTKQATKRSRYSLLTAFFTLIKNSICPDLRNPCDSVMLRKVFKPAKYTQWPILDKELVDKIIFKVPTREIRNRLLLELMARGGLRVSEVLRLSPRDVEDQKLILRDPKSGKEEEVVFIPQKVGQRLKEYIRDKGIQPEERIFKIGYAAARMAVKNAGKRVGVVLNPHDLRRHAGNLGIKIRHAYRDRQQGHPPAYEPGDHSEISWKGYGRGGDTVD